MPDLPAGNSTTDFTALSWRSCLRHLAGLAPALAPVFALTSAAARAQGSYPSRPVRIIVQFAAGGSSDILARTLGDGLSKRLGQPVIVENRSGAGGIIGTDYVVKSAADGYTLLLTVLKPHRRQPGAVQEAALRPAPTCGLDVAGQRTVSGRTRRASPRPCRADRAGAQGARRLRNGLLGAGTQPHQMPGLHGAQVRRQGAARRLQGRKPHGLRPYQHDPDDPASISTLKPYIESGRLRALAVPGTSRTTALPDVPTFAEQGFKDNVYTFMAPTSLMASAKTPDAIVERIGREVAVVVRQPETLRRLQEMGADPIGNTPAQAASDYQSYLPVAIALTQSTGVQPN